MSWQAFLKDGAVRRVLPCKEGPRQRRMGPGSSKKGRRKLETLLEVSGYFSYFTVIAALDTKEGKKVAQPGRERHTEPVHLKPGCLKALVQFLLFLSFLFFYDYGLLQFTL